MQIIPLTFNHYHLNRFKGFAHGENSVFLSIIFIEVNFIRSKLNYFSAGSRPLDKGGAGHPDPQIRRGAVSKKLFLPFGPQFGLKIRGGPSPGAATVLCIQRTERFCPNHFNRYLGVVKEGCAVLKTVLIGFCTRGFQNHVIIERLK